MGNLNSVEKKNQDRDKKIFSIETTGNRLANEYTDKYLDPDFCNQVTMINNDELIRFHHQKVNGKSYSFGYIGDVPTVKETICEGIQEEYRLKKELVHLILSCFNECNARIDSISRGPVCVGNPNIFNEADCNPPNRWIENIAVPDYDIEENKLWHNTLDKMHELFIRELTILENILNDLENHDDAFSIDKIKEMTRIVEKTKQKLQIHCAEFHRHMLTIPTYTPQEIKQIYKNNQENQQSTEAKRKVLMDGTDIKL